MDILRVEDNTDNGIGSIVVRGLDQPLEALEIDDGFVMNALKGHAGHGTNKVSLVRLHDIDILWTDHHVHRLLLRKAGVQALELPAEKFHQIVLMHHAVQNIAFTDEIRHKGVFRFVINILRGADLLNFAAVHDHDGIRHGQGFLLIVGHIDKGDP